MLAYSLTPLAYALSGPLADQVFRPLLAPRGLLAETVIGQVLGVGPGRGLGLMIVVAGIAYALIAAMILIYPRISQIETQESV